MPMSSFGRLVYEKGGYGHLFIDAAASIYRSPHLFIDAAASVYRWPYLFIDAAASIYRWPHL